MPPIPAARMLFELGGPAPAAKGRAEVKISQRGEAEQRAQIAEAHARGVAEGLERGRSERIQSEQQLMAKLMEEQDARLSALARDALGRLDAGVAAMRTDVSNAAARTLVAFFQERIGREAMAALSNELHQIIAEHGASRVTLRGPQAWIDRLAALPEVASSVTKLDLQPNDEIDVTINIDGTIIETTLGKWLDGLGRAL